MADETKNTGDGKSDPPVDQLTLAALQAQIADAHSKLAQLGDAFVDLQKRLDEKPTQLTQHLGELGTTSRGRFEEIEAALVPVAAVAVEIYGNVCHSDVGPSQERIKEAMGPINLRVAKSRQMQTARRPPVIPGEAFDPSRPEGSGAIAPDRSRPNYAPGFDPDAPKA